MFQFSGVLFSVLGDRAAYLDPGSGSVLLQLLLAALLGAGVLFRSQWSRIKGFFGKRTKTEDEVDEDEE